MHKDQTLVIRQIEVVSNSSVRLGIRAVHFIHTQIGEDHSRGVVIGRRQSRPLSRRVESPLEEVNVGNSASSLGRLLCLFGGLRARERQDELRVLACGLHNTLVCIQRDRRGNGVRVLRKAEAPERFDLLVWELADLLDIQVGAEGLDGAGLAGDGACGFSGARFLWGEEVL